MRRSLTVRQEDMERYNYTERMASISGRSECSSTVTKVYRFAKTAAGDGSVRSHKYEYDVYIFYDLEDHDFVSENIIRHLDSEYSGNYKCCYELKDFLPGYNYDECIRTAMNESYWTFLVLSHTSVSKGFTNFLYHQSIYASGAQRLLPIKIDDCEMPESLRTVKIELDFTIMPPGEFQRRLVAVISQATCFLPDSRKPKLGGRQTIGSQPEISVPRKAPPLARCHSQSQLTCTSLPDNGSSVYDVPSPAPQTRSVPIFEERPITPFGREALFIRRTTPTSPTKSPVFEMEKLSDSPPPKLPPRENQKWSVSAFHEHPEQYISNFNHANSSSPNFRQFERTLLAEILPEVRDQRHGLAPVNGACLVRLTCCPSVVVKRRAFCLLDNQLVQDDLRAAHTASGLVECEELLRESLLGKPFRTETSEFQGERLRVYGRLLFYVAMHIEKRHLTFDPIRVTRVAQVNDVVVELLKQIRKLSFPLAYSLLMASHAYTYLEKLVQDQGYGVSEDKLSGRIEELSKVTNFQRFAPWYHLEAILRNENYWVYIDVMLSYVGNLTFKDTPYLHVLLRHLPILLKPYPTIRVQVCYGVLLNVAKMLVSLISKHDRKDIRMAAMFGLKTPRDCPGLTALWNCHLYRCSEFREGLNAIVHTLLLTACDLEVRQTIYRVFFESAYLEPPDLYNAPPPGFRNHISLTEENKIIELIKTHLTSLYERVGDRLEFLSHSSRGTNFHVLDACFNYTISVVVKVPRMKGIVCLVDPKPKSTMSELLKNEIPILGRLSHDHVVELLCQASPDMIPTHAVQEQLNGGTLQAFLHQTRGVCEPVRVSRLELLEKCIHIGEALAYLSSQGIVHRDICAHSVLLKYSNNTPSFTVKLAGFAIARCVSPNARQENATGTSMDDSILLRWSDPESLLHGVWSLATDMWMFWCTVFEVFTYGSHPFPECLCAADVPNMIERGYSLQQPLCMPSDLHILIQQGLQKNIEQRKTVTKFVHSLKELHQDWSHNRRTKELSLSDGNDEIRYPNYTKQAMERMTPKEFRERSYNHPSSGTPTHSTHGSIDFKHLDSPDIVDSSEIDQPKDTLRYHKGRPIRMNVETFRISPERMEVVETLRHLNSEAVCRILNVNETGPEATLVTEMDIGGNVLEAILHNPIDFSVENIIHMVLQVLEGLQQLHTRYHMVHTDLRAQYIYAGASRDDLGKGYIRARIGRLARCKMLYKSALDREGRTLHTDPIPIDSLRWAPPEVILAPAYYSRGSDIYSLGLLLWQLLYAKQASNQPDHRLVVPHPEWKLDRQEFQRRLMLAQHPEQPGHCPDWLYVMIKMCLRDRYKRPTIDLLQETLTHRQPFNSTLLEGVRDQLCNSIHKSNIHFDQWQPECAPYLCQYQEPLTALTEPTCLSTCFEEPIQFYLTNARFGYPYNETGDDALLTSRSPKVHEDESGNYVYEAGDGSDLYDYKLGYDDVLTPALADEEWDDLGYSYADAGVDDNDDNQIYMTIPDDPLPRRAEEYRRSRNIRHGRSRSRTQSSGQSSMSSSPASSAKTPEPRALLDLPTFNYQNICSVGSTISASFTDSACPSNHQHTRRTIYQNDGSSVSNSAAESPTQAHGCVTRLGSAPSIAMMKCASVFSEEGLRHDAMYRPHNVVTRSKSTAYVHHPINDNDTYSHVTKHHL